VGKYTWQPGVWEKEGKWLDEPAGVMRVDRHEKRIEMDEGLRPQCAFAQFACDNAVDVLGVVVDEWVAKFEDVHRTGMK